MSPSMPESPVETSDISVVSQEAIGEKTPATVLATKDEHSLGDNDSDSNPDAIIRTGADAALHLLSLRDDFDNVLTFRSILLASGLACFQAVMNQIYQVTSNPFISRIYTNDSIHSSNRLWLRFREPSSCSSLTSSVMPGLNFFPVATNSKLAGGRKVARETYLG